MTILGLDVSTKTGWAVWGEDGPIRSGIMARGVFHLETPRVPKKRGAPPPPTPTAMDRFARCSKYRDWLCTVLNVHEPVAAYIEGYSYASTGSTVLLVELGTFIRQALVEYQIPWVEVPPTTLKKFVTGTGSAKKELMMLNVYKRFAIDCTSNDEADAVGLAYLGAAAQGHEVDLPKAQLAMALRHTITPKGAAI